MSESMRKGFPPWRANVPRWIETLVIGILATVIGAAIWLGLSGDSGDQESTGAPQFEAAESLVTTTEHLAQTTRTSPDATTSSDPTTSTSTTTSLTATTLMTHEDYLEESLHEWVPAHQLLCLTTGPIQVASVDEPVDLPGNGRGTAICWIGPQHAEAYEMTGSSLKRVRVGSGDAEAIAISLVRIWGVELTTDFDSCGASYGPCDGADLAVIRSDGSVIWP